MTASRWKALGILGEAVRIGKTSYYDLGHIEEPALEWCRCQLGQQSIRAWRGTSLRHATRVE